MRPRNSFKTIQICVLCGIEPASLGQGDHIPPKSLYTNGERKAARFQFHTVPACASCNGAGARHDEVLKLFISFESGEHRKQPTEIIDTMARTLAGNKRLARQIFSTAQKTILQRDSGIQLPVVSVEFDAESYKASVARIARAMYWRITKSILPIDARIEVAPLRQFGRSIISELQECQSAFPLFEVNGGSLKCKLLDGNHGPELLIMQFFKRHTTVALIHKEISADNKSTHYSSA